MIFQFTPLREGRRASACTTRRYRNFNSRPSARGDARNTLDRLIHGKFQFTPLREGRPMPMWFSSVSMNFNSRPSARGDPAVSRVVFLPFVFQFTPLREGRRCARFLCASGTRISIHAPPRGATPAVSRVVFLPFVFQFTPLREGRHTCTYIHLVVPKFQFTPLREGRLHCLCLQAAYSANFNSRPSARGDGKRYAISANLLFNPYKSAWLNNSATQFVEIILVIFHRIIA